MDKGIGCKTGREKRSYPQVKLYVFLGLSWVCHPRNMSDTATQVALLEYQTVLATALALLSFPASSLSALFRSFMNGSLGNRQ
eukprot:756119-Hanusia_phi.AAC.2